MNNKVLIGIIVVIVIGVGAYFGLRKPQDSSSVAQSERTAPTMQEQENSGKKMESMKNLLASGESLECRFSRGDDQGTMSGTVYLSGGKMRGNFTVSGQGAGIYDMHMINDGEYSYTWGGPVANRGSKIKVSAAMNGASQAGQSRAFNYDQQMEYDCSEWSADRAQFNPPSDVIFSDLSALSQPAANTANPTDPNQMKAIQCAACDQAPPESRDQCRQALGC